jgi:hypothetical protein
MMNVTRVFVVTPYYREPPEVLERAMASVRNQTVAVAHILVADGYPKPALQADTSIRHLTLDRAHGDFGDTPRCLGAMLAISAGADAICFLDADNWYEPAHVEQCLRAAQTARSEVDYVTTMRQFVNADGRGLGGDARRSRVREFDTNCIMFLRGAFHLLPVWVLKPKELAIIGDRVVMHALKSNALRGAFTRVVTVNYLATWSAHFKAAGVTVPPSAKPPLSMAPLFSWWLRQSKRSKLLVSRATGGKSFGLGFFLGLLGQLERWPRWREWRDGEITARRRMEAWLQDVAKARKDAEPG